VLSGASVGNRKGYAGYENDGAIARLLYLANGSFDLELGSRLDRVNHKNILYQDTVVPEIATPQSLYNMEAAPVQQFVSPALLIDVTILVLATRGCDRQIRQFSQPEYPAEPPNELCHKQSLSPTCAARCAQPGRVDGSTFCARAPGNPPRTLLLCCVCDTNIRTASPGVADQLISCAEEHEQYHRNNQRACYDRPPSPCCEVIPYRVEIFCLQRKRDECTTPACRDAIDKSIRIKRQRAETSLNDCMAIGVW